ncbi:MAG: hypothetical protein EOO75_16345 [Myxococcales bacterium]|nr:MAG: hypothetical protein EOO75_16345 [Myxococcales bacterium]
MLLLARHEVDFLLAGELAVLLHGVHDAPRGLTLWYRPTEDNVRRLVEALTPLQPRSRKGSHPLQASTLNAAPLSGWEIDGVLVLLLGALPALDSYEACLTRARPLDLSGTSIPILAQADLRAMQAHRGLPGALRLSHWLEDSPDLTPQELGPPWGRFPEVMFGDVADQAQFERSRGWMLDALGEPPLPRLATPGSTHVRFVWLRTWHRPVSVRVDHDDQGTRLVSRRLSEEGGYTPGSLDVDRQRSLDLRTWREVERLVLAAPLHHTPTRTLTLDGADWILEHLVGDSHRGAHVTSPRPDHPLRRACEHLVDLGDGLLREGGVY